MKLKDDKTLIQAIENNNCDVEGATLWGVQKKIVVHLVVYIAGQARILQLQYPLGEGTISFLEQERSRR